MTEGGLPHSEIPGSERACRSPRLIAACRVLHRLSVPRHPSCAQHSLTTRNPFTSLQLRLHSRLHQRTSPDRCRTGMRAAEPCLRRLTFPADYCAYAIVKEPFSSSSRGQHAVQGAAVGSKKNRWAYLDSNQGPRPYQGRALTC